MKKYVAMLLALVMLFALCACGRKIIGAGVFAPNSKKKENLGENGPPQIVRTAQKAL